MEQPAVRDVAPQHAGRTERLGADVADIATGLGAGDLQAGDLGQGPVAFMFAAPHVHQPDDRAVDVKPSETM